MPSRRPLLIVTLLLASVVPLAIAGFNSDNYVLPSHTGAAAIGTLPAEMNCSDCHSNPDWNNVNTLGGAVEILDLPDTYVAGQMYPLRVRLHSDSTAAFAGREWGFQITVVRLSDGEGCGSFELGGNDSLQIVAGEAPFLTRAYAEHTGLGTRDSLGGPVEWTLWWHAPDPPQGNVCFYCAGNAANGSGDPGGDFVFTALDTVIDITTDAKRSSWGALKRRYR